MKIERPAPDSGEGETPLDGDGNPVVDPTDLVHAFGKTDDGVQVRVGVGAFAITPESRATTPPLLSARGAAIFAVAMLCRPMRFTQVNLKALFEDNDRSQVREFGLERVMLEFPAAGEKIDPMPTVAIAAVSRMVYSRQDLSGAVLEEGTLNLYGANTVLRKQASGKIQIQAVFWSAHKEERMAIEAAMEAALLNESHTEQEGRRVSVPQYYDRIARVTFLDVQAVDDEEKAQANEWILVASFEVELDVVTLVRAPQRMMDIGVDIDVGV